MKLHILMICSVCSVLASCASKSPSSRIGKNPNLMASIPFHHQAMVSKGQIETGMSKNSVYLAMGEPSSKSFGVRNGEQVEKWLYKKTKPTLTNSVGGMLGAGLRYATGGIGIGFVPNIGKKTVSSGYVKFVENQVIEWELLQH